MNDAKIHLSIQESELVNNKEWLFYKKNIIDKVYNLLGGLNDQYRNIVENEKQNLPLHFINSGGKISRGENYKGLPFLILDYPAIFNKENIFAVRTMFWWGNFFSISLHLSGKSVPEKEQLPKWISFLGQYNFMICVNENQWEHDFEPGNYIAIKEINRAELEKVATNNFFKVAKKIELNRWNEVPEFLKNSFAEIVHFLKFNYHPDGEKGL
ncbi:MAG: hypothetical protein ABIP35_03870 [Ginsengibacter sp.]